MLRIIFIFLALYQSLICQASPSSDFGETAGNYVASCYGAEFIKHQYCKKLQTIPTNQCMNTASALIGVRYQNEFLKIMNNNFNNEKSGIISDIEPVFKKILSRAGGNYSLACTDFGNIVQKIQYSAVEKMKMIAKYIN